MGRSGVETAVGKVFRLMVFKRSYTPYKSRSVTAQKANRETPAKKQPHNRRAELASLTRFAARPAENMSVITTSITIVAPPCDPKNNDYVVLSSRLKSASDQGAPQASAGARDIQQAS